MKRILWGAVVCLLPCLYANPIPPCISGNSLASYVALGTVGCDVGTLTVKDFVFSVVSSGGGAVPLTSAGITVSTVFLSDGYGLKFSSTGFNVSGAGFVNYLIAYTWDPTADIRGASDILDPGPVDIVTDGCVGGVFVNTRCNGSPITLHVFQDPTTGQVTAEGLIVVKPTPIPNPNPIPVTALALKDAVAFPATAILSLRNNISLNANGGTAGFDSLENDVVVPEPASLLYVAAGLGIAAWRGRKHSRSRK